MTFQYIKHPLLYVLGLGIVAATALIATWRVEPAPPISIIPTADELELEVAKRVCEKAQIIAAGSEPEITLEECLEENARCENKLGPHAIWAGPAPGGFPTCTCDQGFKWVNNIDGTTGTSYGPGLTLGTISAPGRCVARQ